MKTSIFNLLFLLLISKPLLAESIKCPRETARMTSQIKESLNFLDHIKGTYALSGDENCGTLNIKVEDVCFLRIKNNCNEGFPACEEWYWGADVNFTINNHLEEMVGHQSFSLDAKQLLFSYDKTGKSKLTTNEIYIYSSYSNGGGIGTRSSEIKIKLDRTKQLKTISFKKKFGVLTENSDQEINCNIQY